MVVDDALINKLEKLSRLKLNDDERSNLKTELTSMIEMFDQLSKVNTEGIEPLHHITDVVNVMRKDEIGDHLSNQNALKNAPNAASSYFSVPKVIE